MQIYVNGREVAIPDAFPAEGVGLRATTQLVPSFHAGQRITVLDEAYIVMRVTNRPWTEADRGEWPELTPDDRLTVLDLESV